MNSFGEHQSVLRKESVDALNIKKNGLYIDGTFGRGGHTQAILKCLGENGRVIAIDKDKEAIEYGKEIFKNEKRIEFVNNSFTSIGQISKDRNLASNVDGVLLDLGVSSPQLLDADRGFSFKEQGPLDMRMDQKNGITAGDWLNTASEQEISNVLWEFGEERASRKIAKAILKYREEKPLTSTIELANICRRIISKQRPDKHPATKVFQAIRIHINNELGDLQKGLDCAFEVLSNNGRLVVISFHSLEDRMVKVFMQTKSTDAFSKKLPLRSSELTVNGRIVGKKVKPTALEIQMNKRSRSAVMRVLEKVNDNSY